MIQIKLDRKTAQETKLGIANQNWKIRNVSNSSASYLKWHLEQQGYHYIKSFTKARLLYLDTRQERGLMSYEQCDVLELEKSCAPREDYRLSVG